MIRVTIHDDETGVTQVLEGDQALVLVRDGEEEGQACLAGSDDLELLEEMIIAAHEQCVPEECGLLN
jgi:hypothetical protein